MGIEELCQFAQVPPKVIEVVMAKKSKFEQKIIRELGMMFRRRAIARMKDAGITFPNSPANGVLASWVGQHFPLPKGKSLTKLDRLKFWVAAMSDGAPLKSIQDSRPKMVPASDFYMSREWRALRYEVLKANDGRCELCGAGKHDGIRLHVDHIKPRSKFPHLSLVATNLQILCEDCNLGKSNKDDTDWRVPHFRDDEWAAIRERLGEA